MFGSKEDESTCNGYVTNMSHAHGVSCTYIVKDVVSFRGWESVAINGN